MTASGAPPSPLIDVVHESFVAAAAELVAAVIGDRSRWQDWWPDLELTVFQDRGERGIRWNVTGALVGSCEVWLQAYSDGVIVHYYLRADITEKEARTSRRTPDARTRSLAASEAVTRSRAANRLFWDLKDELEGDRRPGAPAVRLATAAGAA